MTQTIDQRLGMFDRRLQRIEERLDLPDLIDPPEQIAASRIQEWLEPASPSPCTQGEGGGEGSLSSEKVAGDEWIQIENPMYPLPSPLPEYREREKLLNHQIIPMHHFVVSALGQHRPHFGRLLPADFLHFVRRVIA